MICKQFNTHNSHADAQSSKIEQSKYLINQKRFSDSNKNKLRIRTLKRTTNLQSDAVADPNSTLNGAIGAAIRLIEIVLCVWENQRRDKRKRCVYQRFRNGAQFIYSTLWDFYLLREPLENENFGGPLLFWLFLPFASQLTARNTKLSVNILLDFRSVQARPPHPWIRRSS